MKFCDLFKHFLNFYRIFGENLGKNLENFSNMHLSGVRGAEPAEASEFIKIFVEKTRETCNFLINFHEL